MKELVDLKKVWDWLSDKWARSFGTMMLVLFAFWFGIEVSQKNITDDCKFVGAFRDGPQAYTCSPKTR